MLKDQLLKNLSGLAPNCSKVKENIAGISSLHKEEILNFLRFEEGQLPVRYLYLGVPFITYRLKATECKALVDSFVKLMKAVLFSIQSYWYVYAPYEKMILNRF